MSRGTWTLLLLSLLSLALLFSCQRPSDDPVVVKVGELTLLQSAIDAEIATLPAHRKEVLEETVARRAFIQELVEGRILAQEARRRFGGEGSSLELREKELQRRELCRYTQSVVIGRWLGYSEADLRQWLTAHRNDLGGDTALSKEKLEQKAAEEKRLAEGSITQFYADNATRWVVPKRIEISAIETTKPEKMEQARAALKRGEPFDQVASRFSEHHTASRGGYWGWIAENENHFLLRQYPEIVEYFFGSKAVEAGELLPVLRDSHHQILVAVNKIEPRRQQSYQEVEQQVRRAYLQSIRQREFVQRSEKLKETYRIEMVPLSDSSAVQEGDLLVTMAKKPWIVGADLLELKKEYNPEQLPHDSTILKLLLQWRLWEQYGIDLRLDKKPEYLRFKENYHVSYWLQVEVDSLIKNGYGLSREELLETMEKHPQLFENRQLPEAAADAALLRLGDHEELRATWLLARGKMGVDSITAYTTDFKQLFAASRQALEQGVRARHLATASQTISVRWLDTLWQTPLLQSADEAVEQAELLLKNRQPKAAASLLQRALSLFPSPNTKRDELTYLMGRAMMDDAQHALAAKTFARYTALYPSGKMFCRALFMEGFLLENNLKQSQEALVPLLRLAVECPDSELLKDALFMVEDIRCNHCKTAEFMKTIGADTLSMDSEAEGG